MKNDKRITKISLNFSFLSLIDSSPYIKIHNPITFRYVLAQFMLDSSSYLLEGHPSLNNLDCISLSSLSKSNSLKTLMNIKNHEKNTKILQDIDLDLCINFVFYRSV